jgi:hypothetical protein
MHQILESVSVFVYTNVVTASPIYGSGASPQSPFDFGIREELYTQMISAERKVHRMFNSAMCAGFWIGLALSHTLRQSALLTPIRAVGTEMLTNWLK